MNKPTKVPRLNTHARDWYEHAQQLERQLDEALEWKRYLSSWGETPEIVYSFIQGQQARISAAQKLEKQRDAAIEGLEKIASCDGIRRRKSPTEGNDFMIPETVKKNPEGGLFIRDLLASLDAGCVYHDKRWSGDTHADLGGTINESATNAVMRDACNLLLTWLPSVILQKRAALRVMERDAKRRMMSGKHGWSDMDAKAAIKTMKAQILALRSLANAKNLANRVLDSE